MFFLPFILYFGFFFLQLVFTTECSIHCICMRMHFRPHVHLLVLCLVRILLDSSQWCDTGNMGTDFGNCISRTFRLITQSQLSAKIKNYPTRYCIMRLFFFFADVKCLIREAEEIQNKCMYLSIPHLKILVNKECKIYWVKTFCRRVFSVWINCNLSAATLYECERNLRNNFFPHRSSFDKLQLTHEQVRIIKHDVKVGEIIKIVAFAGEMVFL